MVRRLGIGFDGVPGHRLTVVPSTAQALSAQALSGQTRSDQARSDQALSDQALSDLALIARTARAAAERLGLAPACPLWPPPLPARLSLAPLVGLDDTGSVPTPDGRGGPLRLPFALIDWPAEQRQEVLAWRLDGTHLAISGGPRSGRSTALRSIARTVSAVPGTEEVHVYAVDGAGALARLRPLPQVEAVIPVHDTERAERLLRRLRSEIDARSGTGPGTGLTPGGEPGGEPGMGPAGQPGARPDIVLLIDGWEALAAQWAGVDHGRLVDELICVLRDGLAVGVHAAISGGRTLLTGAVSALLTERVLLRFADPADAALAGVPSSHRLGAPVAGRGLVIGPRFPEPAEIQVAIDDLETPSVGPRRRSSPPTGARSWQIPELPRRLEHAPMISTWERQVLADRARDGTGRRSVPVGIGGDEALVLSLDLEAGPVTLLVGPSGSGRSSALRCVADGLTRLGEPVLWVSLSGRTGGPSWPAVPVVEGSRPGAATTLAAALATRPAMTVLVDDTEATGPSGPARDDLEDQLLAHLGVGRLVIAGSAPDLLGAYRGLLCVARTARCGLLLNPSGPGEAEVFGLRPERRPPGPPGRALLVRGGRGMTVQLALPPEPPPHPGPLDEPEEQQLSGAPRTAPPGPVGGSFGDQEAAASRWLDAVGPIR